MNTKPLLHKSRTKVARAREQLQGLETEFQRFSDSKPYTLRHEFDVEAGEMQLIYYPNACIPDNWEIIIGEIFHNLRSALDNAVHELTVREQGSPLEKTEFPIFNGPTLFSATKKNSAAPTPTSGLFRIRGLSQKTINIIEALQPYHERNPNKVSILWLIHEMNIIDKHRESFICRQLSARTEFRTLEAVHKVIHLGIDYGRNLDERTVIGRLKTVEPLDDSKVYMDADVAIEVVFNKSCSSAFKRQEPVIPMTANIINGVEVVLNHLETSLD